jgi:hypothetical protein
MSPDGQTINQNDHVLINQNKGSLLQDVQTLRNPDRESDHYLVKTILKAEIGATK